MKLILVTITLLIVSGCQSFYPHEWQKEIAGSPAGGMEIDAQHVGFIKKNEKEKAEALLNSVAFVQLDAEQAQEMTTNQLDILGSNFPYLVRGVSWSDPPLCYRLVYDNDSKNLIVDQYTFNGEIFIPGSYYAIANPIIVVLPGKLTDVIPVPIWGGDRVAAYCLSNNAVSEL